MATRSEQNSAVIVDANFQSTSLSLNLQQLINSRLTGVVTLGYGNSHYMSVADGVSVDRDEDYFTVTPSLSVTIRPGVALSVFYVHQLNSSSGSESRGFSNNQGGASISFSF